MKYSVLSLPILTIFCKFTTLWSVLSLRMATYIVLLSHYRVIMQQTFCSVIYFYSKMFHTPFYKHDIQNALFFSSFKGNMETIYFSYKNNIKPRPGWIWPAGCSLVSSDLWDILDDLWPTWERPSTPIYPTSLKKITLSGYRKKQVVTKVEAYKFEYDSQVTWDTWILGHICPRHKCLNIVILVKHILLKVRIKTSTRLARLKQWSFD